MSPVGGDAYEILGVSADIPDAELRRAYRALVKLHHPDHNGGSPESTARFAKIQDAYARIARLRNGAAGPEATVRVTEEDPGIEQRIADLERELAATREATRRDGVASMRGAVARGAYQKPARATREELGYYETDDNLTSILDDAASGLSERVGKGARRSDLTRRLTDLFGGRGEE